MIIGEIAAGAALGLLHRTGLFQLEPPSVLKRRKELPKFPDCSGLLPERRAVGPVPIKHAQRYVSLCRQTALAWTVWIWASVLFFWFFGTIFYHMIKHAPYLEVSDAMSNHFPLTFNLRGGHYPISCFELFCVSGGALFFVIIYYTSLVSSCCEAEAKLKKILGKVRPVAAAS